MQPETLELDCQLKSTFHIRYSNESRKFEQSNMIFFLIF